MNEQAWIKRLTEEGFSDVRLSSFGSNTDFGKHTHAEKTVQVIVEGELIVVDDKGSRMLKSGDRFDMQPGTTHRSACGPNGCTFIVGVKKVI